MVAALGPYLARVPDGETGERRRWIFFQRAMLAQHPAMEVDPTVPPFALRQWDGALLREMPLLRFREGVEPAGVTFETGYAQAARASWDVFRALRAEGAIPAHVRFQVCLPTPMATAYMYVSPAARAAYIPVYERSLRRALDDILAAVPAPRLSLQWESASDIRQRVARPIDFLHLPVPRHRTDRDYFRPLAELEGFERSSLYLGLIHHGDPDGDRARIATARVFADAFGVASECGWGRTDPGRLPGLLESHRRAAEDAGAG